MSNYDNDSEMKEVMQNFNKETEQRFYEYDKHMIKNRQKCKDQCDKEIQQIIFKMQNRKELTEILAILQKRIYNY